MDAADVMTRSVITVTPETAIIDAARLMLQHRISGLPVVDEGGTMVGLSPKAICCGAPRLAPRGAVRAGWNC